MWGRIAVAAQRLIADSDPRSEALRADLLVGRAFLERAMPETALRRARVEVGADTLMAVPAAGF
jgi:hypothetical protein